MNKFAKLSCVLGSLLVGLSAVLLFKRPQQQSRLASRRRGVQRPVEELVEPLQQAWEPYHHR